jgi:serine phosphatase RsbU (regulator of sigma subunit)/ligand-binding sensor domain-containing protein
MPCNIIKYLFPGENLRFSLFVFICLIISSTAAIAQNQREYGSLPVYNFSPQTYNAHEQNWCITQDNRGIMYFGNNNGVLEYDGVNWRLIRTRIGSSVRSLNSDKKGRVYIGAVNEFGYLMADSIGKLGYHPLSEKIDSSYGNFNQVWNTHITSTGIIFQTYDYLFIYNKDSIRIISSTNTIDESFLVNDIFYARLKGVGLVSLIGDTLVLVPGGEIFSEEFIYGIVDINPSDLLIATSNSGFYKLDLNKLNNKETAITRLRTPIDDMLRGINIFKATKITEDRIAIGTWGNGVILVDTTWNLISVINKNSGLQDQVIQGQYVDRSGNLWLALSNGIARVEINSPVSYFNDRNGILGTVQSVTRFNNAIYTATLRGLYYLSNETTDSRLPQNMQAVFKIVKGFDEVECWDVLTFRNKGEEMLLVVTNNNITGVDQNNRSRVILHEIPWKLCQSRLDPARVFVGLESGLASIYRKNGTWINEGKITGIDEEIRYLSEDHLGNLWMGTAEEGVLKLVIKSFLNDRINEINVSRYDSTQKLPEGPFLITQTTGLPIVATNKGLYKFNVIDNRFVPDSSYGKQFSDGSHYIHRINTEDKSFIWMVTASLGGEKPYQVGYLKPLPDKSYEWIYSPFLKISEGLIHDIFIDKEQVIWLGGAEGLYRYDMKVKKDYFIEYNSFIRNVTQSEGEPIFEGTFFDESELSVLNQSENLKPILPYSKNSVIFNYSAQSGEDEAFLRFSYFLEGNDNKWSEWTTETKKEYTNLYEGAYIFRVKAKNVYDNESTEATYEFTILPPWFRKWWAFILYFIFAIGIVYAIVKLYTRRLRQIIRERTAEVVRQKEEIQVQKEEIEQKNNDILDSIQYAKKIQTALLPPEEDIGKLNLDGFILFLPRDIVSGDFYWLGQKNGKTITVAADCTGHGVPGAFMSMLGVAFLNNIIREKDNFSANQILNELREQVITALRQKGQVGEQKEGMDIAMHIIDWEKRKLEFAGAYNPLILIRNETVFTIKADRMPIGIGDMANDPFQNNVLDIVKGDVFYTYSDGYQDQFGGLKNKKFMAKRLKDLFLQIAQKPMKEQKEILLNVLYDWMKTGGSSQIDDVIVIGVRI